ncbi:MAG: cytochrome ubiquinol oxidase subunit I [Rhodobiaceae bacterium]|nr:cytochrome ubiquinol oxidase subunit I [Rhodobiaceae bacterium]MCC0055625.1 cytochrome ubiquinol oxidase subunit I [Rhodobiaceae bacterium]
MSEILDPLLLARFQFAFTVSFHIIFPSLTIGLASYLAVLEALWLWRGDKVYLQLYRYWSKIFALSFGMGVVSGIVMSYQIGTNWGPFADQTGPVLGPLLGYEVLSAFFLEAGFLGIMLFGMERVGKGLHFSATVLVAIGTLFSAFWIMAANSWMQTPAGFTVGADQFLPDSWLAIIFNPSFPHRLIHMVLAAYLTTAFVVAAVSAWHILKGDSGRPARVAFSMAMWMATIVAPAQLVAGDILGLNTFEHQPAKVAAIEGHWETQRGAPFILFGMPDMAAEETRYALEIPKIGSLILTHSFDGEVPGLKAWPPEDRPFAPLVFWSFRIMVGLGLLMILMGMIGVWLRWRGRLYDHRSLMWFAVAMGPSGFVAVIAGWITTEAGRQPWIVQGLLRTADGVSPVAGPAVGGSLLAFIAVYFIVFGAGFWYLAKLFARPVEAPPEDNVPDRAAGVLALEAGGEGGLSDA